MHPSTTIPCKKHLEWATIGHATLEYNINLWKYQSYKRKLSIGGFSWQPSGVQTGTTKKTTRVLTVWLKQKGRKRNSSLLAFFLLTLFFLNPSKTNLSLSLSLSRYKSSCFETKHQKTLACNPFLSSSNCFSPCLPIANPFSCLSHALL